MAVTSNAKLYKEQEEKVYRLNGTRKRQRSKRTKTTRETEKP